VQTGVSLRHSLSFNGASDKGAYRVSITDEDSEGVFDNNRIQKTNFNFKSDYKINPWLKLDTRQDLAPGFVIDEVTGRSREILYGSNTTDLTANPDSDFRNPYFVQSSIINNDERNRYFGYLAAF